MKKLFNIVLLALFLLYIPMGCKKTDESQTRLAGFAKELNNSEEKTLETGNILTGCDYIVGDSLFVYRIKVPDNRYDKLDADSLKNIFVKDVKSVGMSKVVRLLNRANVGIMYRLKLPDNEVVVIFTPAEIKEYAKSLSL